MTLPAPTSWRNLGPKSTAMLASIGIHSLAELAAMGAVKAFIALKQSGQAVSLNLLWGMEGALSDRHWRVVAQDDRLRLLLELDALGVRL